MGSFECKLLVSEKAHEGLVDHGHCAVVLDTADFKDPACDDVADLAGVARDIENDELAELCLKGSEGVHGDLQSWWAHSDTSLL